MKRGRLPLTALRSFEAAGRLGSFTLAAEELYVSQAAISRQIRELEALSGTPLFERQHRGVSLTEAGGKLLDVLTASFDMIDAALTDIAGAEAASQVRISSEPTFAALWLVPNLDRFQALHPNVEVIVESDPRRIEFRASQAEIALRFSENLSSWPRAQTKRLVETRMVPIAAPSLVAGDRPIHTPGDLARHVLIHDENRDIWARWFEAAGIEPPENDRGPVYADGSLVLQAAVRGHGVGLIDSIFVDEEAEAGRIQRLFEVDFPCGAYHVVARDFTRLTPGAKRFVDWILAEFAATSAEG